MARSSVPDSSPQVVTASDERREQEPKSFNSTHDTATIAGAKCPFEADGDTSEGPLTCRAKTEAGPSTLKVITEPIQPDHLPDEGQRTLTFSSLHQRGSFHSHTQYPQWKAKAKPRFFWTTGAGEDIQKSKPQRHATTKEGKPSSNWDNQCHPSTTSTSAPASLQTQPQPHPLIATQQATTNSSWRRCREAEPESLPTLTPPASSCTSASLPDSRHICRRHRRTHQAA